MSVLDNGILLCRLAKIIAERAAHTHTLTVGFRGMGSSITGQPTEVVIFDLKCYGYLGQTKFGSGETDQSHTSERRHCPYSSARPKSSVLQGSPAASHASVDGASPTRHCKFRRSRGVFPSREPSLVTSDGRASSQERDHLPRA